MARRRRLGVSQIASIGLLVSAISWQVIEPKPLKPAPIDIQSRGNNQQSSGKAPASVKQVGALLSANPRSTKPGIPNPEAQSSVKSVQIEAPPVQGSDQSRRLNKIQPNKRQADLLDHSNGLQSGTRSRRHEDPWFLDQAPLPLQPYRFVYNVKGNNGLTEQYRQEAGDGKFLTGSYGYVLPDGIYRHVDYVADDRGFRAFIRTSEPGTKNENPADVVINSNPVPQQAGPSYSNSSLLSSSNGSSGSTTNTTSLWNYSGSLQAPIDISRSSDGVSLARRPPGSIINTSSRDFNSLAYLRAGSLLPTLPNYTFTTLPTTTQSDQLPPLFESTRSSSFPTSTFNLSQLQPTSWTSNSWNDRRTTNSETGSNQLPNRYAPPSSSLDSSSKLNQNNFFGGLLDQSNKKEAGNFEDSSREQSWRSRNEPSRLTVGRFGSSQALSPARTGPNLLRYDQSFVSYPREDPRKIYYDSSYVYHLDSPFLSLERTKNIAQLGRFNMVAQGLSYPRPFGSRDSTGHLLGAHEISPQTESKNPTSGSSSSSLSEQHHELHPSRQFVDSTGKEVVEKENKSGHSTTFGGEASGRLEPNSNVDQLLLPPKPQFQSAVFKRLDQGQSSGDSGVKGQTKGRLMAPYAGYHEQQQQKQQQQQQDQQLQDDILSAVKSAKQSSQIDSQRVQKTLETSGPVQPTSPSPPGETAAERMHSAKEGDTSRGATKSSADLVERQLEEMELARTTTKVASSEARSTPSRTVRVPEEYRSKMLMNDIRSMQNAIGLPQPPRFQRFSLTSPDESISPSSRFQLSDGLPQTHSGQQSATLRSLNKPEAAELRSRQVEKQPRKLNSGQLDRSTNNEELPQLTSNDTFEAQRLGANKARELRLENLSELEKFQQRLRSQQKLLESIKPSIDLPSKQIPFSAARSSSETPNSQVKYDEPNDYESHHYVTVNEVNNQTPKSPEDQTRPSNAPKSSSVESKLLHTHKLDLSGRSRDRETHENEIKSDAKPRKPDTRSPNTINLDFINSVTALSVDHLNPFAISSVNPAVQQSAERLSPHRLSLPAVVNSTGFVSSNSLAAPSASVFGSLNSFERQDSRQTVGPFGKALRIDATGSSSLVPNNHRSTLGEQVHASPSHLMHEAANSQHKSFMPTPIGTDREVHSLDTNRDGFEISDWPTRADSHKFFEVVAN